MLIVSSLLLLPSSLLVYTRANRCSLLQLVWWSRSPLLSLLTVSSPSLLSLSLLVDTRANRCSLLKLIWWSRSPLLLWGP